MIRILALFFLFAPLLRRDLDVGVPPGTPLEWTREFRKPVPTGHRGGVPVATGDHNNPKNGAGGGTQTEDKTKNLDFVVSNLYDYFKVTTVDIMTHVNVNLPKSTGKVSQDDVSTGGGFVMQWNYPPDIPVELVWMAAMSCIREEVHPEVISWPESATYCMELGEAALYGAKAAQGKIGQYLQQKLKPLPPAPPQLPKPKDLLSGMMMRLAAVELTGGFPNALDPTFARRTLGLGDDAFYAVLECSRSPHTFLAHNAVSVLANYSRLEATDELKKILKESKDPVMRVRAILGLARQKEKSIVPDLVKEMMGPDEPMRALAIYALGVIGDPAGAAQLLKLVQAGGIRDTDLLWSAIPALGRMKAGKDILLAVEAQLLKKIDNDDTIKIKGEIGTPTAEEHDAKFKVLRQLAVVALALVGEKKFVEETQKRIERKGPTGFHPATHYLLIEALVQTDEGAKLLKSKIAEWTSDDELVVKLEAMRALGRAKKLEGEYLKDRATGTKVTPAERAICVQLLPDVDEKATGEACAKLIAEYAGGKDAVAPDLAFLYAVAAQIGGRLGKIPLADLVKAVERAYAAKAFSRREGDNEPDITKAKVSLFPALLETLLIELGRTAQPTAFETLKTVLTKSKAPQGRAEAALALGNIPGKDVDGVLLEALEDKDGWVRYCAYKALATRSAKDFFCDWIFGDGEHRRPSTEQYKEWAKSR